MTTVTINRIQNNTSSAHAVELVSSFEELYDLLKTSKSLRERMAKSVLQMDHVMMAMDVMRHQIPPYLYTQMKPSDIAAILPALDWMDWSFPATFFTQSQRINITEYITCDDKLANGTLKEFIYIDEFFSKYLTESDPHYLYGLTATIWRKVNTNHQQSIKTEDRRVPLISRAQVSQWIMNLRHYHDSIFYRSTINIMMAQSIMFAFGLKKFIHDMYGPHLFGSEGSGSMGVNFGWHTVAMDLASTHVFGNLDQVMDTNFHDLCAYLVQQKQKAVNTETK